MAPIAMASVPKTPIQTLVFFDLEATGLTRPRITELCLLSVQREELLTRNGSPRVVNKLTVCVDPQKLITPIASSMTGLYNDSLECQTPFDKSVVDTMALFLSRLPQPVCLVAHYGNGFDYPLLNAELKRAKCEFPLDVVCVDSLDAIRTIDTQTLYEEERARRDIQNQNNSTPTHQGIPSVQAVRPNNVVTSELQTRPAYTATVKQDCMHAKRKADTDSIDHIRKRLFTDGDKVVEDSENKLQKEITVPKPQPDTVPKPQPDTVPKPQPDAVPKPQPNTVPKPQPDAVPEPQSDSLSKEEVTVGATRQLQPHNEERSISSSLMLDSQQSVTDDMLMAAVDLVEANANSDNKNVTPAGSSANNVTPAGSSANNVTPVQPSANNVTPVRPSANNVAPVQPSINNNNVTPVRPSINNNNVTQGSNISVANQGQTTPIILPILSYKLDEIYRRTFGTKPPVSHTAEDDCVTLMKVCKKRCPQFLEWVNDHQVSLSSVSSMY